MRTLIEKAPQEEPRRTVALLTGSYSEPEDFRREGFPAALAERGLSIDMVMAQMRPAWFADGSLVARIRAAIVEPARSRGFAPLWLGGISLGALATMAYAARHESDIAGIVLLSPYPGTRPLLDEIRAMGGPGGWTADPSEDLEREAWRWLASTPARRLPVYCYFGRDDRFAPGQRCVAAALGGGTTRELDGGHDWAAWRAYWARFLDDAAGSLQ